MSLPRAANQPHATRARSLLAVASGRPAPLRQHLPSRNRPLRVGTASRVATARSTIPQQSPRRPRIDQASNRRWCVCPCFLPSLAKSDWPCARILSSSYAARRGKRNPSSGRIGRSGDWRWVICEFRSKQMDSSPHLKLPITDMGKCQSRRLVVGTAASPPPFVARRAVILSSSEGSRPACFSLFGLQALDSASRHMSLATRRVHFQ